MQTFILHELPRPVFSTVDLRHNSRSFQLSFAGRSYPETVFERPNCFPTTSAIRDYRWWEARWRCQSIVWREG